MSRLSLRCSHTTERDLILGFDWMSSCGVVLSDNGCGLVDPHSLPDVLLIRATNTQAGAHFYFRYPAACATAYRLFNDLVTLDLPFC